jgi:hypothetical protein
VGLVDRARHQTRRRVHRPLGARRREVHVGGDRRRRARRPPPTPVRHLRLRNPTAGRRPCRQHRDDAGVPTDRRRLPGPRRPSCREVRVVAVLGIQNLVHQNGVFGHLARVADRDDIDDFLTNRIVSGPIPALRDATFDQDEENGGWEITAGTPTWEGQNVETCQAQVDEWGITAFKAEAQHDTDAKGGGMFDHVVFRHIDRADCPQFQRAEVWCDPAVTNTDKSDSMAVQCDALGVDKVIYRLRSWERRSTPEQAIKLAVVWAMLEGAGTVGIETDQGGDTWRSVMKVAAAEVLADLQTITDGGGIKSPIPEYVAALAELSGREWKKIRPPRFAQAKAGSTAQPKEHRIQQMLTGGYEQRGGIVHVIGTHLILERALFRFPARKPYDLADASYWSWAHLSVYGRPVTTSTAAGKKKPFAKLPVARPGVSSTPRVGFGRVVPRPPPGSTGRR